MTALLSVFSLILGVIIGLGRQITVFTAFRQGLWIFRRYGRKRLLGIVLIAAVSVMALLPSTGDPLMPALIASWALALFAVLFSLNWLFPALYAVGVARPGDQEHSLARDQETVLLATVTGERRAYPLNRMVMARHLVHDSLGGREIVVTYCALCRSGLVFASSNEGVALRFRVVGVFRRNLIMEDRETGTLWQQATGEAILGPLTGARLDLLNSEQVSWAEARSVGGTSLAYEPEDVSPAPLASDRGLSLLHRATQRVMAPGMTPLSPELGPRETVFGIAVKDEARAYPLSRLSDGEQFTETVAGVALTFTFASGNLRVTRMDGLDPPVVQRHWWLGWKEFHPETSVFRSESGP